MSAPVLVSCDWLHEQLHSASGADVVVVDVSWSSKKSCLEDFNMRHIPGARFVDIMDADHCDVYPRNIPSVDTFTNHARAAGVNNSSHVVVYSDTDIHGYLVSGRGWWTFKYFGHDRVSVLDGGLQKWIQLGYPSTSELAKNQRGNFTANINTAFRTTLTHVADNISNPEFQLVDSRKSELHADQPSSIVNSTCDLEYISENNISGSKNLPMFTLLDSETGTMKSQDQLKQMFTAAGIDLDKPVVTHCNSGMSSCAVALAALVAGASQASVYMGGFTEWRKKVLGSA